MVSGNGSDKKAITKARLEIDFVAARNGGLDPHIIAFGVDEMVIPALLLSALSKAVRNVVQIAGKAQAELEQKRILTPADFVKLRKKDG